MVTIRVFTHKYRFCLVISCALFVGNDYGMEVVSKSLDEKHLVLQILTKQNNLFSNFSLEESLQTVSALVRVNQQYNKDFNDSEFTRRFMRSVGDTYGKFGQFEAEIVKTLHTKGAKNYCQLSEKLVGIRPWNTDDEIIQWIQDGADIHYRKLDNMNSKYPLFPLFNAVKTNSPAAAKLLFTYGVSCREYAEQLLIMAIDAVVRNQANRFFDKAIKPDDGEMFHLLLINGATIDFPVKGIPLIVHGLCCKNIVKSLLERGVDVNCRVKDDPDKEYLLEMAAYNWDWNMVRFLYENGAVTGGRKAFDSAQLARHTSVTTLRCNGGSRSMSGDELRSNIQEIESVMRDLLVKKIAVLTEADLQDALCEKDVNLLRLYCECDKDIDTSGILAQYPDLLQSVYK